MIMTAPMSVAYIFISKLFIIGLLLIFVQGTFFLLYFVGGKLIGLTSPIPKELLGWLFRGWIASLAIGTLQLALSMRFRSFAVPIGIGMCATFLGLGMYVLHLGLFFPHSLLTMGMGVLSQSGLSSQSEYFLFLIMNLLYILVISAAAIRWMQTTDVAT